MPSLHLACFGSVLNELADASQTKMLERYFHAIAKAFRFITMPWEFSLRAIRVISTCGFGRKRPEIDVGLPN